MTNKRYFISGVTYPHKKRIAIMRNDIDEIGFNGQLIVIYFKNRAKLCLLANGEQVMCETQGLFNLYNFYRQNFDNTSHSYTINFNKK